MTKLTDEQVEKVVSVYTTDVNADYAARTVVVNELAKEMKVSVPTIRGILVSKGVYLPKPEVEKQNKESGTSKDKAAIVKALEAVTGKAMPSLEKATKKDLETLWNWIVLTSDNKEADKKVA